MVFSAPIHTKLTATQQHYVEISHTEFHPTWSRSMGGTDRIEIHFLSEVNYIHHCLLLKYFFLICTNCVITVICMTSEIYTWCLCLTKYLLVDCALTVCVTQGLLQWDCSLYSRQCHPLSDVLSFLVLLQKTIVFQNIFVHHCCSTSFAR